MYALYDHSWFKQSRRRYLRAFVKTSHVDYVDIRQFISDFFSPELFTSLAVMRAQRGFVRKPLVSHRICNVERNGFGPCTRPRCRLSDKIEARVCRVRYFIKPSRDNSREAAISSQARFESGRLIMYDV